MVVQINAASRPGQNEARAPLANGKRTLVRTYRWKKEGGQSDW